jgi:RNA polymerase sigma factor (TIGR02999 family)
MEREMAVNGAGTVTNLLHAVRSGAPGDERDLFALVYRELRRLAGASMKRQPRDHSLQPTALAHEAYLRLMGGRIPEWKDREHFFRSAARAMRSILVDFARRRASIKRGGCWQRVELEHDLCASDEADPEEVIAVHEALERLERIDPERSRVVELRFFCGLSVEETAHVLGTTTRTVYRAWNHARAWLYREIRR